MKISLCRLIFAALIVAAAHLCSVSAVAQSYPLVCRGNKDAVIEDNGAPQGVSLRFKKGSASAAAGLAPGECSWIDRGMNAAEPNILVQPSRELRPEEAALGAEYKWTVDLKDPDKYWTFDVYSDGKGHLIVTGSHNGNRADSGGVIRRVQPEVTLARPPDGLKKEVTVATPLGEGVDEAFTKAPKAPLYWLTKVISSFWSSMPFGSTSGDCLLTASIEEKGYAIGLGFRFERVIGYALKTQLPGTVPLHRLFKNHDHFLTTDEEEKGYAKGLGYRYEGVVGYVSKTPLPGTTPLYRFYDSCHCYITGDNAKSKAEKGVKFEKVEAYVWTSP